jgi:hypothetical protein
MAEIFGRILLGIVEGLFELLFEHTGRSTLSLFGVKTRPIGNLLLGLLVWMVLGCALAGTIAGFIERHG